MHVCFAKLLDTNPPKYSQQPISISRRTHKRSITHADDYAHNTRTRNRRSGLNTSTAVVAKKSHKREEEGFHRWSQRWLPPFRGGKNTQIPARTDIKTNRARLNKYRHGEQKEGTEKIQRRNQSVADKVEQARRREETPPATK